jgi:translation initiation factor 2-alpha kinase 4
LRLDALNDKDLSILLHIELPPEWPKIAPLFKLKEAENVRPHVSEKIRSLLKTVQPDNDIYTICADMQEVMEDAAESKVRRKTIPALNEERARQETDALRKAELEKARRAKEDEEQQVQANASLAKKVESLQLRSERVQGRTSSEQDDVPTRTLNLPNPLVRFEETMSIADKNGNLTYFRDVWGTYVVLKTEEKKVTVVTPVVKNDVTARRLLLKQIRLDADIAIHPSQLLEEVRGVENLLRELKKRPHESVVDVFGYKVAVNHEAPDPEIITSIDLTILSAYANKGSLAELLDVHDSLQGSRIITWTTQLLDALAYYDVLGHAHPAVHLNNILIFRADDGHTSVKLSDGYGTDLRTLVMQERSARGIKEPSFPTGWKAPELNQAVPARTEKTCLWDLGVVIMQMISGKNVITEFTSPSDYLTHNVLTDELYDMLQQMCAFDQNQRSNAYDLTSAEFLRGDGSLFISATFSGASPRYFAGRRASVTDHNMSQWKSDWEEVGKLGKGGFGEVVKARNRTDTKYYAVKKVRCKSDDDMTELLREIKLLAGLNSPRIVRYNYSWVEFDETESIDLESSAQLNNFSIPQLPSTGKDWVGGAGYLSSPEDNIRFQSSSHPHARQPQGFFINPADISSSSESDDEIDVADFADQQDLAQRRAAKKDLSRTLYIAMELCEEQSLRTIIKQNSLTEIAEIWRLFGQIVEGLAYIHGRGLIHRDLKPDNIFLDERKDVKIGDFGLATRGKLESVAGKPAMNQATDTSRSLGTALYVAPELRSYGQGAYTSKVDMYALGVTLLEMCCPVATVSARVQMLGNARMSTRNLPTRFSGQRWESLRGLVYALLNHNQEERPSASDIIASEVIPQPVGSEAIQKHVKALLRDKPEEHGNLVQFFFGTDITPAQDLNWDSGFNDIDPAKEFLAPTIVSQKLEAVFQRHGAVEGERQGIFPLSSLYVNPATFLDKSGVTLQLSYDLTLPFARLLAHKKIDHARHYSFGVVYREGRDGGRPSPFSEASFDIVSYSAKDLSIKDAEILKVVDEIMADFPSLKQNKTMVIYLNHTELLDMLLKHCGIDSKHWSAVKLILSTITTATGTWKRIEKKLRDEKFNLPSASIQQLAYFNFQDDLQGAHKKLQKGLTSPSDLAKLQQIFTRLLEIQQYAESMKVELRIVMNPLVNNSESLYRGSIMFQVADTVQKTTVAVGGRYDHLIQSYGQEISTRGAARAVGLRFNPRGLADRLTMDMTATGKSSKNTQKLQRCDVLVTSFDEDTLKTTCLAIAADLWANDVRAELTNQYSSFDDFAKAYKNYGQCLVAVARQDSNAIGGVAIRVRALGRQEEEEVKRAELASWLKDELKAPEPETGRGKLRREISVGESSTQLTLDVRPTNVVIVPPKHKGKKTNRQALVDDAALIVREEARNMVLEAPILVVEVNKEVLEYMRATRIDSPESWKAFFQACPAEETRYLKEVQDGLEKMAEGGSKGAWVYSSKTRACIYYGF